MSATGIARRHKVAGGRVLVERSTIEEGKRLEMTGAFLWNSTKPVELRHSSVPPVIAPRSMQSNLRCYFRIDNPVIRLFFPE
jgi:hypothetical protein